MTTYDHFCMAGAPENPEVELDSSPLLPSVTGGILFLVDSSASMLTNGKIQSLNVAAEESLPRIRQTAADTPGLNLCVRVLAFGTEVNWLVATPTPINDFIWPEVTVEEGALTELGLALSAVIEMLGDDGVRDRAGENLILFSDGMPTNTLEPSFETALGKLNDHPRGRSGARIAVAIGDDADPETLESFVRSTDGSVLSAQTPQQLADQIRLAGATVITGASESIW